jgi:GAF domain-containing protein
LGQKEEFSAVAEDTNLIKTLAALNEIGAQVNRLSIGQDLQATLRLIVENAVRAVAAGAGSVAPGPNASAVIWVYDQAQRAFDPNSRVSAGEPQGASTADLPRPNGLGRQAIERRRRLLSYEERNQSIHPAKTAVGAKSLACYPLIVGDEIVGVLYVYRCDERPFTPLELLLLDNFVNLAALAIHHGRQVGGMSRALARKVSELEKLGRASRLVSSRSNLDETLQEILAIGLDMTAAQYGSFELYDKKRGVLNIRALAGRTEGIAAGPPLAVDEESVIGRVALHRQSLLIGDLQEPPWQRIYQPLPVDRPMRSELAVPLIGAGGGLEGVLNLESPLPYAFKVEDQRLLEALATQMVIALQEIRLLDALQEIVGVLLTTELDELLKLIIDRACDLINVPVGSIWTIFETNTLILRQSTGGYRRGDRLPLDRSFTGRAIRLRQPITIDDVRLHPDFQYRSLAVEQGWVSAIVVPLLIPDESGRALGSFSLYADYLRDFSDWDKKLLTCLANHAAVAIQDAEQLIQLKQARERQATAETFAAVGDVAANLLHQLNNKIGIIPARVQGIEDKCPNLLADSPYLSHSLQEIDHSARQAMYTVRESLSHLRPLERQPVIISACLERALQRAAPPPVIKILRVGLDDLPPAMAGEQQLEMVFYNLIDNALKAMENQGELRLSGAWQGDEVAITVADTGPGIAPEIRPHLFEFSPATIVSEVEQTHRLGFGLWWVKTFVDRFGGRLLVESEPGQGSAFTVCLPAEKGR